MNVTPACCQTNAVVYERSRDLIETVTRNSIATEFFRQINTSSLRSLAINARKVCVQLLFFEPMLVSIVLPLHELLQQRVIFHP